MASRSGFSKDWQGFVDHKWSKKRLGASFTVLLSGTHYQGIGRSINPTVYSLAEFKSKLAAGNHFLTSVLKGQKVFLVGDEDELRKVGRVRLAKARTN